MENPVQISALTRKTLEQFQQEHLIQFWDQLTEKEQLALQKQINEIDFPLIRKLLDSADTASAGEDVGQLADKAVSPEQIVRLPASKEERNRQQQAVEAGEALIQRGKVGAILVAGGQGSRLGFEAPKGTFPIGPVTERTLFQILCEQLAARADRAGTTIPYFIMTSEATHFPTVAFFEQHKYFGLGEDNVYFFQQASLPAFDAETRRILLESPGRIATSPDGHGGMLRALQKSGLLDVVHDLEIEHLYYHQVDNPTAIVCDPAFLGAHLLSGSDVTTKVVAKVSPEEKMGALVTVDGKTRIIEYSDLPPEQVHRMDSKGNPIFWAGSTAIHVFKTAFIDKLLTDDFSLPFHKALKKVPHVNQDGKSITPDSPNAIKFEQFIFDSLPFADVALAVEADRKREFNPVKNAEGADSPETSRKALRDLATSWIEQAGGKVQKGVTVEISPRYALDADELKIKLSPGAVFKHDQTLP